MLRATLYCKAKFLVCKTSEFTYTKTPHMWYRARIQKGHPNMIGQPSPHRKQKKAEPGNPDPALNACDK